MAKTNLISQRTFLNAILTGILTQTDGENEINLPLYDEDGILNDKVRAYAEAAIERLDKHNAERKPSKAAIASKEARENLISRIKAELEVGKPYMASEVAAAFSSEGNEVKTARITAAFKAMDGVEVGETKFKGRTVKTYTIKESE